MPGKPQLHQSGMDALFSCGVRYDKKYNQKLKRGAMSHLHVGKGVDESVNANMTSKIEEDRLLSVEQLADIASDKTRASIDQEGFTLAPDEFGMTERAATDRAVDKAVRLSTAHAKLLAPKLLPAAVQKGWSLEIPGFQFDLVGTIDLVETTRRIRDTKSSKKSPNKLAAEQSDQITSYGLAESIIAKTPLPLDASLDYVVDLKRETKVVTLDTTRDAEDFQVLIRRMDAAARVLETGAFTPARQTDWWCSLSWCEYADTCEFFRKPKTLVLEEGD